MSASDEWTEWHLTPRGWERGSEKRDFSGVKSSPAPDGSVAVYRYRETLGALGVLSSAQHWAYHVRGDESAPVVVDLMNRYGPCPTEL